MVTTWYEMVSDRAPACIELTLALVVMGIETLDNYTVNRREKSRKLQINQ
jgi:hypothetical protein